jgi:hypothetical protein
VLVGSPPNQTRFNLVKDIMTRRSGYFAAARSGRWTESKLLKATDLTAEDPEVFNNYLRCAYNDRVYIEGLEITEAGTSEDNAAVDKKLNEEWEGHAKEMRRPHRIMERLKGLMKVYLLANVLLDHKTANMVVDETLRSLTILKAIPSEGPVQLIYDNTVAGDRTRNFWTDWYVHNVATISFPDDDERPWPNDFLVDVVKGLQEVKKMETRVIKTRVVYRMDQYFVTWNPTEGPHRYYSGPGTEGEELVESDEEDLDYEFSEGEAVMTDDEEADTEMTD